MEAVNPYIEAFYPTNFGEGVVQVWDYESSQLIHRFEHCKLSVRGVDLDHTRPLVVSGGDDCKIKPWNYESGRCSMTLLGPSDYVRSVQLHPGDCPRIISASDDETIRIWDIEYRLCF